MTTRPDPRRTRPTWLARRALDLLAAGTGLGLALPLILPFG